MADPITYTPGSDDVIAMVGDVAEQHHPSLADAVISVIEASRKQRNRPVTMKGADEYGRAGEVDLILTYSGEVFETAKDEVKLALIDNALAGWEGTDKAGKGGEPVRSVYQRCSSISVYPEVLKRHGPVLDDWKEVQDAVTTQLTLPLDGKGNGGSTTLRKKSQTAKAAEAKEGAGVPA